MRAMVQSVFRCLVMYCVLGSLWVLGDGLSSFDQRPAAWNSIKHIVYIIFENGSPDSAFKQSYFNRLAQQGAYLSNFHAITHPSQPNYIAMIAGSIFGIFTDTNVTIWARHLGDVLEEAQKSWKVYAEDYPGECFLGRRKDLYVRKHVPFLSFRNVQSEPDRCNNIVSSDEFMLDVLLDRLPSYSMYIPNLKSDGHDTGVDYANDWLKQTLGPILEDSKVLSDTLFIITFDEDDGLHYNRIYTVLLGAGIRSGARSSQHYNHYDMLKTVEAIFQLNDLGRNDKYANVILDIWR